VQIFSGNMKTRPDVEDWLLHQSRHHRRWLVILALMLAAELGPVWPTAPDAVAYLSISRSIATGHGLRNLGFSHIAYPPGYPLLISPAFFFPAFPFAVIAGLHWLLGMMLAIGLYRWARHEGDSAAMLLTALVMVNVSLWTYSRVPVSELAFMTIAVWAVIALNNAMDAPNSRRRFGQVLLGAVLVLMLSMIREAGVVFAIGFLAAVCAELWRGRLRALDGLVMTLPVCLLAFIGLALFLAYDENTFRDARVFGTHLAGFLDRNVPLENRLIEGVRLEVSAVGRLIVPGMFKAYGKRWMDVNIALYIVVVTAIAVGWWRSCSRRSDVYVMTVPFYLALYAVWSFDADTRYLLPILPVICISLWCLIERYQDHRLTIIAALVLLHLGVALGYTMFINIPAGCKCNQQWTAIARIASLVKNKEGRITALAGTPKCSSLILSYLTDKPVTEQHMDPSSLSGTRWLVAPANALAIHGFSTAFADGKIRLLKRTSGMPTAGSDQTEP
jgi:hypothetical protein